MRPRDRLWCTPHEVYREEPNPKTQSWANLLRGVGIILAVLMGIRVCTRPSASSFSLYSSAYGTTLWKDYYYYKAISVQGITFHNYNPSVLL